jgi:hypothetical protein
MTRGYSYEKHPVHAYGGDPVYWRNAFGGTPGYAGFDGENDSRSILIQSAPDKNLDYAFDTVYAPWIDADTIAFLSGTLPPGAVYDPLTKTFSWPNTVSGNYSFSVLVTDAVGNVSTQWVRVAVSDTVEDGKVTVSTVTGGGDPNAGADTPPLIDNTPKLGGALGPEGAPITATDTPLVLDGPPLAFTGYPLGLLKDQPGGQIAGWFHKAEGAPLFTQLGPQSSDQTRISDTSSTRLLRVNASDGELLLTFSTNSVCPP